MVPTRTTGFSGSCFLLLSLFLCLSFAKDQATGTSNNIITNSNNFFMRINFTKVTKKDKTDLPAVVTYIYRYNCFLLSSIHQAALHTINGRHLFRPPGQG